MLPYKIIKPKATQLVPIIVSVPHCGIVFPEEIAAHYLPEVVQNPDDTDWFVDQLYDFVSDLGIIMIKATYSRYVIDLNRSLHDQPLYNDGRVITSLVPKCDFLNRTIYADSRYIPTTDEIQRRLTHYYMPYHNQVKELLTQHKNRFGQVLLFDAHSIRKHIPTIKPQPFPDLILGDNDGQSATADIIQTAWQALNHKDYELTHNDPFKGGYITRSFAHPKEHIYTLQLEMAKLLYMNESETHYDEQKAQKIREVLIKMFTQLIEILTSSIKEI